MNRRVPPVAVMLILHIHCIAESFRDTPANREWLETFLNEGLVRINLTSGSGFSVTVKGQEWVERILGALPDRGYGGKAEGFYIIGKSETPFRTIELARQTGIARVDDIPRWPTYIQGAYVLRAVELLEPIKPRFKITYLS